MEKEHGKPTLITEDMSTVSGRDKQTGADVTKPRQSDGKIDESTDATDKRENRTTRNSKG